MWNDSRITTPRTLRYVIVGLLGIALAGAPSEARASNFARFAACGSGSTLVGVTRAARAGHSSDPSGLREVASESYQLIQMNGGLRVASSKGRQSIIAAQAVAKRVCNDVPSADNTVRVADGGALPGVSIAALAAVLDYRQDRPWPLGSAHEELPDTTISVQSRGRNAYVMISDFRTVFNGGGCAREEYYRIDPTTFEVLPSTAASKGTHHCRPYRNFQLCRNKLVTFSARV